MCVVNKRILFRGSIFHEQCRQKTQEKNKEAQVSETEEKDAA